MRVNVFPLGSAAAAGAANIKRADWAQYRVDARFHTPQDSKRDIVPAGNVLEPAQLKRLGLADTTLVWLERAR